MKKILPHFSIFEIALYLCSIMIITISFFAFHNDQYLYLVGSLIGATSLIFLAKGHFFGQIFMIAFALFYGYVSYSYRYYGEMITYIGMTLPMAISSLISWLKHPFNHNEVKVNQPKRIHYLIVSIISIIVTLIFYFILNALKTNNLIISTLSVLTSFLAASLTFLRSRFYALGYVLNDIVLIVLWIMATIENFTYLPMVICFVAFLVNDFYGFINWTRMLKKQELMHNN